MLGAVLNVDNEIRRAIDGTDRNPGATAPSSPGATREATADTSDGAVQPVGGQRTVETPERGATGPAFQGGANDFAWQPQARIEVGPHSEAMVRAIAYPNANQPVAGVPARTVFIDPTRCPIWWVNTNGQPNVTVLFRLTDRLRDGRLAQDAPQVRPDGSSVIYSTVWVERTGTCRVTWPSVWWPADQLDFLDRNVRSNGTALEGPIADAAGISCYVFMHRLIAGAPILGNVSAIRWRAFSQPS